MVRPKAPWRETGPVQGAVARALCAATRVSTPVAIAGTLAALMLVAAVDDAIGDRWTLGLFYYFPVAFAAWRLGRGLALGVGLLCSAVWYLFASQQGMATDDTLALGWSIAAQLLSYAVVAVVVSEMRELFERERRLARYCHLTGALSGRAFRDVLDQEVALAQQRGAPLGLVYVDMDDFKALNDRRGHAAGDAALEAFAAAVQSTLRDGDYFARTGGDEFVVLLTGPGSDERAVIDHIRRTATTALGRAEIAAGCSMGAILVPGDRMIDAGDLMRRADKAMYEAKRAGKGGLCVFEVGKRSPLSVAA